MRSTEYDSAYWADRYGEEVALVVEELKRELGEADRMIAGAVEIMTPEQVGQWTGVRTFIERDSLAGARRDRGDGGGEAPFPEIRQAHRDGFLTAQEDFDTGIPDEDELVGLEDAAWCDRIRLRAGRGRRGIVGITPRERAERRASPSE